MNVEQGITNVEVLLLIEIPRSLFNIRYSPLDFLRYAPCTLLYARCP